MYKKDLIDRFWDDHFFLQRKCYQWQNHLPTQKQGPSTFCEMKSFITSWNLASIPVPVTTNITILFYLVNQKSQIKDYHLYFIELSRPVCGANTDKTVRISSQINGSIDTILSHVYFSCILSIKSSSRNTPTPFFVVVVSCLTQTFFTNGNRPINISVYLPFPQDYNVHQILPFQGYISLNLIQFLLKQKKKISITVETVLQIQ